MKSVVLLAAAVVVVMMMLLDPLHASLHSQQSAGVSNAKGSSQIVSGKSHPLSFREKRASGSSAQSLELCGRWDDWCAQSIANPVLQCCPGYTCRCSVWNSNCKCRTKMFG